MSRVAASPGAGDAEIAFERRGSAFKRGARRIMDDRAAVEDHGAVGHPEDLLRVLLDDDGDRRLPRG